MKNIKNFLYNKPEIIFLVSITVLFICMLFPLPFVQVSDGYFLWVPRLKHSIELILSGQIPFWNEFQFGGTSLLADGNTNIINPTSLFYFIMDPMWAYTLSIISVFIVLLIGSWGYFRERDFSKTASMVSTICYIFSGQVLFWSLYHGMNLSFAFFPLILFSFRRYRKTNNIKWQLIAFLLLLFSLLGGFIQFSLIAAISVGLEGIDNFSIKSVVTAIKERFITIFCAVLSASVIIMPTIETGIFSHRKLVPYVEGLIPNLSSFIKMMLFGTSFGSHGYPNYFYYIGAVLIALFIFALIRLPKKEIFTSLFTYSLIFPILALSTILKILPDNFQFGIASDPFRGIFVFIFAMAIVIGKCVDKIKGKTSFIMIGLVLFTILNGFFGVNHYIKTNIRQNHDMISPWQIKELPVKRLSEEGRFLDLSNEISFLEDWAIYHKIRAIGGYGSFFPKNTFMRIKRDSLLPEKYTASTHFKNNNNLNFDILAKYGIKYIFDSSTKENIKIEENPKYVGRAYTVNNKGNITGKAKILANNNSHVKIAVNAKVGETLILADSWFPGWNCYINGKTDIGFDADGFRGYKFSSPGNCVVEWKYQPKSFLYGSILSCFGLLSFFLWMFYLKIPLFKHNKVLG